MTIQQCFTKVLSQSEGAEVQAHAQHHLVPDFRGIKIYYEISVPQNP